MYYKAIMRNILVLLGLLIVISVSSINAATVSVTDYGANGSGSEASASTNVTAFQNAFIAAGNGGTVLVPQGIYCINAGLSMDGVSDLTLKNATSNGATIKRVSTGTEQMDLISVRRGCIIEGLTFDGNRSTDQPAWSFGIRIDWGDDVTIRNCTIQNCPYDGILVANNRFGVTIENCNILNNHRMGIAITDADHGVTVKKCYFSGNTYAGLDFEPDARHTGNHIVNGCHFENEYLQCFGASFFPWNIVIEDCNFVGNESYLYSERGMNIVAKNNDFSGGSHIRFNSGHGTEGDDGLGKITMSGNTGLSWNSTNLLSNAEFENWTGSTPTNWTLDTAGTYTIEKGSPIRSIIGTGSVHLTADGGKAVLYQTINVTAGNHYTFGGYIQTDGGNHYALENDPLIRVEFLNASNVMLADVKLHGYYDNLDYGYYEKIMGIAQAPAGSTKARVSVGLSSGTFEAYYDGLFFHQGIGYDGIDLTDSQKIYRFDFQPAYRNYSDSAMDSRMTMPDYNHVDQFTLYTAERGYGFKVTNPANMFARRRSSSLTNDIRAIDFVSCYDKNYDHFAIDLPNGQYIVTFAGGDMEYNTWCRFKIENTVYGLANGLVMPENAPLYIFDVGENYQIYDIPANREGSGNAIQCYGYDPFLPEREVLYLQRCRVTVQDGQLNIANNSTSQPYYNWLEIAPAPFESCQSIVDAGFNYSADINDDCYINFKDFALFVDSWLTCNNPADANCLP